MCMHACMYSYIKVHLDAYGCPNLGRQCRMLACKCMRMIYAIYIASYSGVIPSITDSNYATYQNKEGSAAEVHQFATLPAVQEVGDHAVHVTTEV